MEKKLIKTSAETDSLGLDDLVLTDAMAISEFEKEYVRINKLPMDELIKSARAHVNSAYAELTVLMEKSLKDFFYSKSFGKVNAVLRELNGYPVASKFAAEFILRATTPGIDADGREGAVKLLAPEKEYMYCSGLTVELVKGVDKVSDIPSFSSAMDAFKHTRGTMFSTLKKKAVRREWAEKVKADVAKLVKAGDKEAALTDAEKKALESLKAALEALGVK